MVMTTNTLAQKTLANAAPLPTTETLLLTLTLSRRYQTLVLLLLGIKGIARFRLYSQS